MDVFRVNNFRNNFVFFFIDLLNIRLKKNSDIIFCIVTGKIINLNENLS